MIQGNMARLLRDALVVLALLTGCSGKAEDPQDLDAIFSREKTAALAAARIGAGGGTLQIKSGQAAGFALVIPPGALSSDAVFSFYAAKEVGSGSGYLKTGSMVRLWGSVSKLNRAASLRMPFEVTEGTETALVAIYREGKQLENIAGASVGEGYLLALIKRMGEYGVVLDPKLISIPIVDARCPYDETKLSLITAIAKFRSVASGVMTAPFLFRIQSLDGNGCGASMNWEAIWYDVEDVMQWTAQASVNGVTEVLRQYSLPCGGYPIPITPTVDSTTLSDDIYSRLGKEPAQLNFSVRSCDGSPVANPPLIRVQIDNSGNYIEYTAAGVFSNKTF